jgi:hypothetical protein
MMVWHVKHLNKEKKFQVKNKKIRNNIKKGKNNNFKKRKKNNITCAKCKKN